MKAKRIYLIAYPVVMGGEDAADVSHNVSAPAT
jgi:hypothetical protein